MKPESEYWNVPLMRDTEILERSPNQAYLTRNYAREAVAFIEAQAEKKETPFFLYLAHSMPHVPIFASGAFSGSSQAGRYGDVIEEIDWSVGQVLQTLKKHDLAENTLVLFTSDNGPWLPFKTHGGSAGHLRDGKGSTWEGGMCEPTIFWGPGTVEPKIVHEMGSTLDIFATFLDLARQALPEDRVYDGASLAPVLTAEGHSPRQEMFFYHGEQLHAVRKGEFKLHFTTKTEYVGQAPTKHDPPLLFHLGEDPGEKFDVAAEYPEVVKALVEVAKQHQASFVPPPSQLEEHVLR
jgi:arylsulfatase A-like enzyme